MTLAVDEKTDNGTDGQTDGQTDRQTDRVRRNMRPPPREEGRIINSRLIKIRKLESHETGHNVWKNLNQTCSQSVPTADRRHWKNKLSPLTRRRSANPRLNDFGRSFVVQPTEVINNYFFYYAKGSTSYYTKLK